MNETSNRDGQHLSKSDNLEVWKDSRLSEACDIWAQKSHLMSPNIQENIVSQFSTPNLWDTGPCECSVLVIKAGINKKCEHIYTVSMNHH